MSNSSSTAQINPRIDCSQSPLAVRLTPEEVVALDMNAPKGVSEYRRLAKSDLESPPNLARADTVYFCGGGMNSFAINAYGEMGICVISQQETFDVRPAGLKPAWENSLHDLRTRKRTRVTKCVAVPNPFALRYVSGQRRNGKRRQREPRRVSMPCSASAGGDNRSRGSSAWGV